MIKHTSWKLHSKRALYFLIFDDIVKAKATLNTIRLSDERNVSGLEAQTRLLREQSKVDEVALKKSERILIILEARYLHIRCLL
jgi:hypothetical protein